jgi:hypothetical protein
VSSVDPQLQAMIDRLVAMPRADRQHVLTKLGRPAMLRLVPLLEGSSHQEFSPGLQALIDADRAGEMVTRMTRKGLAALRSALQKDGDSSPVAASLAPQAGTRVAKQHQSGIA